MLNQTPSSGVPLTPIILVTSVVTGALIGYFSPPSGQTLSGMVDFSLLALVGLLFFGVRFGALIQAAGNVRFLGIALLANFVFIPLIGYGIAVLFLTAHPLFMVGLVIYFMAPCTDWFLGFTRLAHGNVALGTTLLPVNMLLQLMLYPLYLKWFMPHIVETDTSIIGSTLLQWFLIPFVVAVVLHQVLRVLLTEARFDNALLRADQIVPWLIGLLVLEIFAANIAVILEHRAVFVRVLLAVFTFFVMTFLLGEGLSRHFRLRYPEHALLTMTTAARNAPLMLAVTMVAMPGQPLIYAALVTGMLVEFPHLTALRQLLIGVNQRHSPTDAPPHNS